MNKQLLVNKIICPDGTELRSRSRHHFVEHTQEDGREYFVDDGLDYQRIGHSDKQYTDCTCYTDDPIEKIREHFTWTSILDKNGNRLDKPVEKLLKDLDDGHVDALVEYTNHEAYPQYINDVFVRERAYRMKE